MALYEGRVSADLLQMVGAGALEDVAAFVKCKLEMAGRATGGRPC